MRDASPVTALVRGGAALLLLVVGAATSVATALVHTEWWGLAWGIAAGAVAVWALPSAWWGRFPLVAGWLLSSAVVLLGRPEGDFLVADTGAGYLYLGSGLLLVLVAALAPRRTRHDVRRRGTPSYTR